jgi:hypothetical protein
MTRHLALQATRMKMNSERKRENMVHILTHITISATAEGTLACGLYSSSARHGRHHTHTVTLTHTSTIMSEKIGTRLKLKGKVYPALDIGVIVKSGWWLSSCRSSSNDREGGASGSGKFREPLKTTELAVQISIGKGVINSKLAERVFIPPLG